MPYTVANFVEDIVADPAALGVSPGGALGAQGCLKTFVVRLTNETAVPTADSDSDHCIRFPFPVRLIDAWIRKIVAAVPSSDKNELATITKSDTLGTTAPSSPTTMATLSYEYTNMGNKALADTEVYRGGTGTAALLLADPPTSCVPANTRVLVRFSAASSGKAECDLYMRFQLLE